MSQSGAFGRCDLTSLGAALDQGSGPGGAVSGAAVWQSVTEEGPGSVTAGGPGFAVETWTGTRALHAPLDNSRFISVNLDFSHL